MSGVAFRLNALQEVLYRVCKTSFSVRPTIELCVVQYVMWRCHVKGWSYCTLDNGVLIEAQILFRRSYRM